MGKSENGGAGQKLRAAIYTRISLDKKGDKEGIERQMRDCELICRLSNFEIVERYPENSISAFGTEARSAKERPKFDEMIEDFKARKFDVIVAWKLDRLVRSVAALEDMLRELNGLCICTTDLGGMVDLRNPASVLQAQIMASMAQFESARKSERFKAKYRDAAKQGYMRSNPNRSFGYTHNNEIIPEEAEAVIAIFKAYAKGAYMGEIADALNGKDKHGRDYIPTIDTVKVRDAKEAGEEPPDIKWTTQRLSQILRNPKYVGWVYHAPTGVDGKHQSYSTDRWKDYIVRDDKGNPIQGKNFDAIIDEDTWTAVQLKLKGNLTDWEGKRITRGYGKKSIGSGVYICGECGTILKTGGRAKTRKLTKDKDGNVIKVRATPDYGMTYHCPNCGMSRIASHIDKYVLAHVKQFVASDAFAEILNMTNKDNPRIAEITDEISSLRLRIEQTNNDYYDDVIPAKVWSEKVRRLEEQITALDRERTALLPNSVLSDVASAKDRVAAFEKIDEPRAISAFIDTVFTVKVKRHARGKRITAESIVEEVSITWKEGIFEEEETPSDETESADK